MEPYRLLIEKTKKPLIVIDYSFDNDQYLDLIKSTLLPTSLQSSDVKAEFDLAKAWSTFLQKYLETNSRADVVQECWHGHYNQFGRVMLEIMRLSRDKQKLKHEEIIYEMIPELNELKFLNKPHRLEDEMFCRIWLSLIRHPAFIEMELEEDDVAPHQYWQSLFTLALGKTNDDLVNQAKQNK